MSNLRDDIIKAIRNEVFESEVVADHIHQQAAERATDAAIAVVLERAAEIAENHEPTLSSEGDIITAEGERKAADEISAAIRDLAKARP